MLVPTDLASALLVIVLVVPGFVFGTVRSTFRGPTGLADTQLSSRIATAVMISVVFDAAYLIAVGLLVPPLEWARVSADPGAFLPREPQTLGIVVLALGFVVPAAAAVILYYRFDWRPVRRKGLPRWLHKPVRRGGYRGRRHVHPGAAGRRTLGRWVVQLEFLRQHIPAPSRRLHRAAVLHEG